MRVLVLSPGSLEEQLDRLPALASISNQLSASVQVACNPAARAVWELLPALEKVLPFSFETSPNLADWTNLLGSAREPDFQVCINFAEGREVNLMLSMSHIPTRVGRSGFSCTDRVEMGSGWAAQRLAPFLKPLGCVLDADQYRLTLSSDEMNETRSQQPEGDGPLLLLAAGGGEAEWPPNSWRSLTEIIKSRLPELRTVNIAPALPLRKKAAAIACADVVLSSCRTSQRLAVYNGIPLVALGARSDELPERSEIRCLGDSDDLASLPESDVLSALGF